MGDFEASPLSEPAPLGNGVRGRRRAPSTTHGAGPALRQPHAVLAHAARPVGGAHRLWGHRGQLADARRAAGVGRMWV